MCKQYSMNMLRQITADKIYTLEYHSSSLRNHSHLYRSKKKCSAQLSGFTKYRLNPLRPKLPSLCSGIYMGYQS